MCLAKGHYGIGTARLNTVPTLAPPAPRAKANPEEFAPVGRVEISGGCPCPVTAPRKRPHLGRTGFFLQGGGPTDQASHRGLAAPNPKGVRPGLVSGPSCSCLPPAQAQVGRPHHFTIPRGLPQKPGEDLGAAEASQVQPSWFTLHPRGGREGEKCKDPARWAVQKRDGCRRRGLFLVIVIAGELDQQAIFSHLSRKIQVRANS